MKQIKRYACILITVLLLASTPSAALAAAEYVPTKAVCTSYTKKGNEWVQNGSAITYTWSYKKDGRLIKTASLAESGKGSWVRRSWKGDLVKKVTYEDGSTTTYKYKKGMLTQVRYISKEFQNVSKYSIKKKKAVSSDGNVTSTISYNGKGQYKKVVTQYMNDTTTKTYKYYSDGNLKKLTTTDNMGSTQVVRFNKKGYLKSFLMKSPSVTITTTYSYKYKKGKIRECIVTRQGGGYSSMQKFVYTKWREVSRTRNCDGHENIWSIGVISAFDARG